MNYLLGSLCIQSESPSIINNANAIISSYLVTDYDMDFCFGVAPSGSDKKFILAADNEKTKQRWLAILRRASAAAPELSSFRRWYIVPSHDISIAYISFIARYSDPANYNTLPKLLHFRDGYAIFSQYLAREYALENLNFYSEVEKYECFGEHQRGENRPGTFC